MMVSTDRIFNVNPAVAVAVAGAGLNSPTLSNAKPSSSMFLSHPSSSSSLLLASFSLPKFKFLSLSPCHGLLKLKLHRYVYSYGTVDYERRPPMLKWNHIYKRISLMDNPQSVLDQIEKEGNRLTKWELSRVVRHLRKFRRYNLALQAEIWKGTDVAAIHINESPWKLSATKEGENLRRSLSGVTAFSSATISLLTSSQAAFAGTDIKIDPVYEVGELFELGIQLSYLLLLLALLGVGSFFVIRQVLVRRELDLSAKELQEQVRSGDASATELFELGAVMLRRKFYPAATKFLLQAIDKWDGDDQDLAQVYNALGVSYVRDGKLEKGIAQFEKAVKVQPGYVTAWNNLGDAYEQQKDLKSALKAFEEVLLFDPNNKVARPRVDSLRERVNMYKGVPVRSKDRS